MKYLFLVLCFTFSFTGIAQETWGNVDKNKISMKEIAPVWPGCESNQAAKTDACFKQKLAQHVQSNFRYPTNAWKNNIQERIVVTFMINTQGEVEIKNVEGKNQELKDEAKRNILAIPKMKPGMLAGKPRAIEYKVPFNFKTGK
ncbi:energy transducer TonB [uncultured Planktosalinus sp.]|uniref:energy transducer TonB n=1 Tax=uncultured Planktosalinus sp. TaxID=1810935 RepID=UPI0030D9FB19